MPPGLRLRLARRQVSASTLRVPPPAKTRKPLGTRFARLGRFPMGRAHPQGAVIMRHTPASQAARIWGSVISFAAIAKFRFFGVFSGDSDHGIPGNAFGGTESGYWKYGLSTSSRYRLARLEIYRTRRRTSTLGYAQNIATLMMDKCQRVARRSLSCCIQCPANAGFCVFRG